MLNRRLLEILISHDGIVFLQPVGFATFATKDDAEAAKLEMQVFYLRTLFFFTLSLSYHSMRTVSITVDILTVPKN